ncbi:AAA family ATPase [Streptomyces albofaciens]|uniref:AAA family ATPase n=1 Tax=Streptomyces albofaciens TaxID=66866 RepID=UPI00142EAD80|nr:LuxR family transcriptional regulator [Streptomyces albofaciens]
MTSVEEVSRPDDSADASRPDLSAVVARRPEMRLLRRALADSGAGQGGHWVVYGETGAGKTAVLRALREEARVLGHLAVELRCTPMEGRVPFGTARKLIALFGESLPVGGTAEESLRRAGEALPSRETSAAGRESVLGEVLAGLQEAAQALTTAAPLLITVDDIGWSDAASLDCFSYLLSQCDGVGRFLLVLTLADGEPVRVPAALEELRLSARGRIDLGGLDLPGTAALVTAVTGRPCDDSLAAACRAATAGNPLFLRALARCLPTRRAATARDVAGLGPRAVADHVLTRLARVSEPASAMARTVAVLGDGVDPLMVAELANLDCSTVAEAADVLVRTRLFRDGGRMSFRHPVVAAAIREQTSTVVKNTAHMQAAEHLQSRGAPAEQVAGHLMATTLPLTASWMVDTLRSAARSALVREETGEAVEYLQRAVRDARGGDWRRAAAQLADVQLLTDPSAAIGRLSDMARRGVTAEEHPQLLARLADASFFFATRPRVRRELAEAVETVAVSQPHYTADTQLYRVLHSLSELSTKEACELGHRYLASDPQEGVLRSAAGALSAVSAYAAGRSREAALDLVKESLRDPDLYELPNTAPLCVGTALLVHEGYLGLASEYCRHGIAVAKREGRRLQVAALLPPLAGIARIRGNLREAEGLLRTCLKTFGRYGVWRGNPSAVWAGAELIGVLVDLGESAAARTVLGESGCHGDMPTMWSTQAMLTQRARVRMAAGELDDALEDLRECGRRSAALGLLSVEFGGWRRLAAEVAHQLGRHQEARRLAEEELETVRDKATDRTQGAALRTAALVIGGEAGLGPAREAVRILTGTPDVLELARAQLTLGTLLRGTGDRVAAQGPLAQAHALASRCGAAPVEAQAREQLHALGRHQDDRSVTGLLSLTKRERQVLSDAVRGRSNGAIADALFITRRTVEIHLTHAYRKLGIQGRKEFAELYKRQELWALLTEETANG